MTDHMKILQKPCCINRYYPKQFHIVEFNVSGFFQKTYEVYNNETEKTYYYKYLAIVPMHYSEQSAN